MDYKDQLILTGNLDDVGNPIRSTSEKSYRLGFEIDGTFKLTKFFYWQANFTLSENKNVDLIVEEVKAGNTTIAYSPSFVGTNFYL